MENLRLQPGTTRRTMVVFTTIETEQAKVVRRDMVLIIREREKLVNSGFAGRWPACSTFFCGGTMVRNNSLIGVEEALV